MMMSILCIAAISLIPISVHAEELNKTKDIIEAQFEGIEPIKIAEGVYLRDNGECQIVDVDVSKAEKEPVEEEIRLENGQIFEKNVQKGVARANYWDLDASDYAASFQAKYRVFCKTYFKGYEEIYVDYTEIDCPSGSKWKAGLYIGYDEKNSSKWYTSDSTQLYMHYWNMSTSESYRVAFEKTDNDDTATGKMRVHLG